jgi:hypothetical protein
MTVLGRYILALILLTIGAFYTGHPVVGGFLVYVTLVLGILGGMHMTSDRTKPTPKQ